MGVDEIAVQLAPPGADSTVTVPVYEAEAIAIRGVQERGETGSPGPPGPPGPVSSVTGLTQDDLTTHINSPTPHPVYDDMLDLTVLLENGLL